MRISDWSSDVVLFRSGAGSAPRRACPEGMRGRPDTRKPSAEKKHDRGWGRRRMRYPASEKLEIIRIVDRKSVVEGKSVSVRVAYGGRRSIKKRSDRGGYMLTLYTRHRR